MEQRTYSMHFTLSFIPYNYVRPRVLYSPSLSLAICLSFSHFFLSFICVYLPNVFFLLYLCNLSLSICLYFSLYLPLSPSLPTSISLYLYLPLPLSPFSSISLFLPLPYLYLPLPQSLSLISLSSLSLSFSVPPTLHVTLPN